jgi:hypothetical protein
MEIFLIRPWRDSAAAGGCCSAGPAAVRFETAAHGNTSGQAHRHGDGFAETYRLLRTRAPGADVQMVAASNTLFLLPATYRAARRHRGRLSSLARAIRSTTAGVAIMDGEVIGSIEQLGPAGVVDAALERAAALDRVRPIA